MSGSDRRRSARHLLGVTAEVHVGPETVLAVVHDVSRHGMGLVMPKDVPVKVGETIWILASSVASYAITATVRRVNEGLVGVELEEVLSGEALDALEKLPLADGTETPDEAETQSLEAHSEPAAAPASNPFDDPDRDL